MRRVMLKPHSSLPGQRVFANSFGPPGYVGGEEEELPGVIVGCDIINQRTDTGDYTRHYALGSEMLLTVLPVTIRGGLSGEGSTTLAMRYADDSFTRVYEIDPNDDARHLLAHVAGRTRLLRKREVTYPVR